MNIYYRGINFSGRKLLVELIPHFIAILVFLIIAALYCKPVFENKVLVQEDYTQWEGMARNSFQYKEKHGHFPLWSNNLFSGMPAYQIAMDNPQSINIPGIFYDLLTLHLQKPVSFFVLACICFYFLVLVLGINPYIGIIGSLAYAYATYNPVIIAVGHDTKMQSIALLPAFAASLIWVFEQKYFQGAAATALFTALLIGTGHMQIVYYGVIIATGLTLGYVISWIRQRDWKRIRTAGAIVVGAGLTGVLCNSIVLFTTYDSATETVRGGSELANAKSSYTSNGLSTSMAFDYSMYKIEPFVMMVPKMFGGSTGPEMKGQESKAIGALHQMPPQMADQVQGKLRFYWGGIGDFVSGPPYAGAIICFLALIGFLIIDGKHKWWILGTFLVSILMSWGGYFEAFNSFLLKYLPLYNKFRAPSMIIVIPTFLLCMMAVLTLQKILDTGEPSTLWKKYKWGLLLTAGIFGVLLFLYHNFDYTTTTDQELLKQAGTGSNPFAHHIQAFIEGLKADRQRLFMGSIVRSFLFIVAAALAIGLHVRSRIRPGLVLGLVGILSFADVMGMDMEYLNSDNYQKRAEYEKTFEASAADSLVLRDKSCFRVFDLRDSAAGALSYGAMTAWFHRSIGGYHAAKLKIYEDLINYQLMNFPDCQPAINMLNTKYIIYPTASGNDSVYTNPGALGPAWFVNAVRYEPAPLAVMNRLTHFHPADTAILFEADRKLVPLSDRTDRTGATDLRSARIAGKAGYLDRLPDPAGLHEDTAASSHRPAAGSHQDGNAGFIQMVNSDNDDILYKSDASARRFAVFSEIFYNRGWHAWIDDKEVPILRTNYVLRGLSVPAGHHIIRFSFHPSSYYWGRQVQWMASILLLLLIVAAAIVCLEERRLRYA